jgi:opacity protein-like surface antigen
MMALRVIVLAAAVCGMAGEALAQNNNPWWPRWQPNVGVSAAGRQINSDFHGFGQADGRTSGICVDTDVWDTAIRYAGEFAGFRIAANVQACEGIGKVKQDIGQFEASTRREESFIATVRTGPMVPYSGVIINPYVEGGVAYTRFKVEAIPFEHFSGYRPGFSAGFGVSVILPRTTPLGTGTVQPIDAAATEVYLAYRHYNYSDATLSGGARVDLTVDEIMAGARIRF